MSTLIAMVVAVIVIGMLLAYYVGYAVGRREGFEAGHQSGKREGSVRAYAVGYDRGRHDRQAKATPAGESAPAPSVWVHALRRWLLPAILSLLAIIAAAVLSTREFRATHADFGTPASASKLGLR